MKNFCTFAASSYQWTVILSIMVMGIFCACNSIYGATTPYLYCNGIDRRPLDDLTAGSGAPFFIALQKLNISSMSSRNFSSGQITSNSNRVAHETSLRIFNFENNSEIRVEVINGEPWFVAKDVCSCLGISWRGSDSILRIPDNWKGVRKFRTPGDIQELIIINEPALYKLSFRSNKPSAERFTNYVASEVLPSIRKTGIYATGNMAENLREISTLKSEYRHLEMMYGMERKLREMFREQRDYYVKDRDEWRDRTMERNNRLLQFIING